MSKITQSGSFLAKHFPTLFKHFSENASQEEFNKAEQEAAVVFQQHQSSTEEFQTPLAADLVTLFPNSHKAIAEKLSAEELKGFTTDATEAQNRLNAQATGNQAVADDLTQTKAQLTKAQGDLTAATNKITELTPKAAAWDAHKAALDGSNVTGDTTNGKGKVVAGLSTKDQAALDAKIELKAKYPSLMADIDVPVTEA